MATNNAVNTTLAGQTGTGSFVGSTSPTLTTPKIGQINDTNGNANLAIGAAAGAVNYMTSVNSATGGYTGFEVAGSDANANAYIKPKGDAGLAVVTSAVTTAPFAIFSGTAQQHITAFSFANTAAGRTVTFPDATGTVAFNSVAYGGTGVTSTTAYAVLCGGTTSTGEFQSVSGVGTSGQVLTSNGAGALPTWQAAGGGSSFPSGTRMIFQQTSAPTGWTKDTTAAIDNGALRTVTGTVGTGGTVNFTTAFASQTPTGTVGATTLTSAQIPAHTHPNVCNTFGSSTTTGSGSLGTGSTGNNTGGGGSHTHSFTGNAINFAVKYYDCIIAQKD